MAKKTVKVDLPSNTEKEKVVRSFEDIQKEYGALAAQSGQLQYQVFTFSRDLEILNKQMRDLNFEAAALKVKEQSAQESAVQNG